MNLKESMPLSEQVAYMVTICHDEWLEQEMAGMAEYNFDEWLPFIGECAVKMASERTNEWPM